MKAPKKSKAQLDKEVISLRKQLGALQRRGAEHERVAQALRSIVEGTAPVTGEEFFRSLVCHLATSLHVRYAFVTVCTDSTRTKVRTLAMWTGDGFGENVEYGTANTPCEAVMAGEVSFWAKDVQRLFPKDKDLVKLGVESYLAVPISDITGQVIGHVGAMDKKPMPKEPVGKPILELIALRAGAELVRTRAEEALRESELNYRKVTPIGLCSLDTNLRYIHINDWLAELNGLPVEAHLGRTIREVLPDVAAGVEQQLRKVIDTGDPLIDGSVEAETSAQPAVVRTFQYSYYPDRSKDGRIVGVGCVVAEITERKRAEEELRRAHDELKAWVAERTAELTAANAQLAAEIAERRKAEADGRRTLEELTDFVEHAPLPLHWVGPDGTILWANEAELHLLGYTSAEYIGHHITEFHADRSVIDDILQRLTRKETLRNYEARLRCKDGSTRYVLISSNVLWRDGQFVHTRCFTRDTTERKRLEEQLRQAAKMEAVGQLANQPPAAPVGLSAGTPTLLIVDNEAAIREFAREVLTRSGYQVLEAGTGEEAEQVCASHAGPIHLLLTDVVMPGMNGRWLAERVAVMRPTTKVLFMTGYTDGILFRKRILEGGTACLNKPFAPDILLDKVREALTA